jgi:hypothetical protein
VITPARLGKAVVALHARRGVRARRRGRLAVACALGCALSCLGPRVARGDGAELDRFEPAERGSRFFAADSLELDGARHRPFDLATGLVATYGHRLRAFGTPAEGPRTTLVEDQLQLHPGAALVMAPGARFAIDLPVVIQSGRSQNLAGQFLAAPGSPVLGDVRLGFDLRLAGPERERGDGVVLAGGVSAWLPTGSRDSYTSDGETRVGVHVASTARFGPILGALRVGLVYRRELEDFGGVKMGSEATFSAGLGWRAGRLLVGPEVAGSTILRSDAFRHRPTPIDGLLGAHATFGAITPGVGVGTALDRGLGAPLLRVLASIEWTPKPAAASGDRDGDGVTDDEDVCPEVPGPRAGSPGSSAEAPGCPDAPRDLDRDGVADRDDACPDLPGVRTRDPMTHGCPDGDRDGVPDPIDACPRISGERSKIPRFDGCPADLDGDDVPDAQDACPDEPGDATPDPRTNGCPRPSPSSE